MDAWRPNRHRRRTPDRALRRDIRRVTSILGETLARAEGDDLLALVEQVRVHAKEGRLDQLPEFDLATITRLVRAFTAYFHLANITEQVHRGRALTRASAEDGRLARASRRPDRARPGSTPARSRSCCSRSPYGPVFTAHPTEVARRSTIDKLRRVAALLEEPDGPRRTRRLEEAVELLWLTDEIRIEPPEPTDEARNVVYYLEGLSAGALPDVLEELRDRLATLGVDAAARRAAAALRQLGRWRPRRQPPRHAGDHARGAHAPGRARHPAAARAGRPAAPRPLGQRPGQRGVRRAAPRGSPSCCPACPRSSRATGGSTPRSPTGCSSPACTSGSA